MELLEILRHFDGALQVVHLDSSFMVYNPQNEELSEPFTRLSLLDTSLQDLIPSCYLSGWYDFVFNEMLPAIDHIRDEQINYIQKVVDQEGVGGFSRACQDVGLFRLSLDYRDLSNAFRDSSKIRITCFRSRENLEKKDAKNNLVQLRGHDYRLELIANNVGNRYLKAHTYLAFNPEHPEIRYDLMIAQEIDDEPFFLIRTHTDPLEYGGWKSFERVGLQSSEIQTLEQALISISDLDVKKDKDYLKSLLIEYLKSQNEPHGTLDGFIQGDECLDTIVKNAYETYALVRHRQEYTPEVALFRTIDHILDEQKNVKDRDER